MRTIALLGTPFGNAVMGARMAAPPVSVMPGPPAPLCGCWGGAFFGLGVDMLMGARKLARAPRLRHTRRGKIRSPSGPQPPATPLPRKRARARAPARSTTYLTAPIPLLGTVGHGHG